MFVNESLDYPLPLAANPYRVFNRNYKGVSVPVDPNRSFRYGTAGFRYDADVLQFIANRAGEFFAHYANQRNGHTYGVMVTASHNKGGDNGLKFVGPYGGPLEDEAIKMMEEVVNYPDEEYMRMGSLATAVKENLGRHLGEVDFERVYNPNAKRVSEASCILVGYDTRQSSRFLADAVIQGIFRALPGFEVASTATPVTTPQLHWLVQYPILSGGRSGPEIDKAMQPLLNPVRNISEFTEDVYVDCANGVGALLMPKYISELNSPRNVSVLNANVGDDATLNNRCGADYVKSNHLYPQGCADFPPMTRIASLDGDADRMLYFTKKENGEIFLFDGDHLNKLFTEFIEKRLDALPSCKLGTVFTGYSDMVMKQWAADLKVGGVVANTGVANLIKKANAFDIAVYFEPNGHGSVIVKKDVLREIESKAKENPRARELLNFLELVNPAIGDGVANFFATEYILSVEGLTTRSWMEQTFKPSNTQLSAIRVPDKDVFLVASEDETIWLAPGPLKDACKELWQFLGTIFGDFTYFVRPSGTENVVRLFLQTSNDHTNNLNVINSVFEYVISNYKPSEEQTVDQIVESAKAFYASLETAQPGN
uniref:Phosphoacetylglucosamine mutase n=1 Tax=Panagrellus redivivus TaxID=6233 RepID=A0A7E4VBG2_PANRE